MGYYTDFYLQATPVTEDQFHSIDSALQELRSMREAYFDDGTGYWENTEDTWYQSFDDMVEVSRHFPEVTFTLTGYGDQRDDQWIFGRKNAISIGKDVILLLGIPTHIRIRVNEEVDSLVIEPTEEKEVMSFKVPDRFLIDRHCNFRIHSQQFVRSVMIKNGMDLSESYSIVGRYIRSSNAAIFSLKGENSIKKNQRGV